MSRCIIRYAILFSCTIVVFVVLNSLVLQQIPGPCSRQQLYINSKESKWHLVQDNLANLSDDSVDSMIRLLENNSMLFDNFWRMSFVETREALRHNLSDAKYLLNHRNLRSLKGVSSWMKFNLNINEHYLYDWLDPNIDRLLIDMAILHPTSVEQNTRGSELKFNFIFESQFKVNVKPMRYSRDTETNPNHFVFDEFERHFAEIAAFHLDRLLGFCRVPPTTGRRINLTEFSKLVPENMRKHFFKSPVGNTCFYGNCDEHCNPKYAFCGQGDQMEFSLMVYIPAKVDGHKSYRNTYNPYRQAYTRFGKAEWELHPDYCRKVQEIAPYSDPTVLLNLVDIHIFDFLTGNRDRHSIHHFRKFGEASNPILYDNGRGFGKGQEDYFSILTPVWQCCKIKKSTLLKLVKLYRGPDKLSTLMNESLQIDPVAPVLLPVHLQALDRRVVEVLKKIAECIVRDKRLLNEVIFWDI